MASTLARVRTFLSRVTNKLTKFPDDSPVQLGNVKLPEKFQEGSNVDATTHTGQKWEDDDYRRLRFYYKDKQVNPQFAIDLIEEDPIVVVNERFVWSNSGGALGHPKVYINLDKDEVGVCGYSGRKFIQQRYYDSAKHGPSITYDTYLEQMKTGKF